MIGLICLKQMMLIKPKNHLNVHLNEPLNLTSASVKVNHYMNKDEAKNIKKNAIFIESPPPPPDFRTI